MDILLFAASAVALLVPEGTGATARPPSGTLRAAADANVALSLAKRWSAAWNSHDGQALGALFTPDSVYQDMAFQARFQGRDGIAAWVGITAASIPDASVEVLEAFGSKARVTIRWRFKGTPRNLGAVPGTGRSFDVAAVTVLELRDGLIAREQDFYDLAGLQRQIGVAAGAFEPAGAPPP